MNPQDFDDIQEYKEMYRLLKNLVDVYKASSGKELISAQGQAMDGFTTLANYEQIAKDAYEFLEDKNGTLGT
jgi:hypothetical protein